MSRTAPRDRQTASASRTPSGRTSRGSVPLEPASTRRARTKRGGPRTPLPLILLIALAAGAGVAYVSQSAYATQATYQASDLERQNASLTQQSSHLDDQLARLRSVERIVAAAQALGMRPSAHWAYVPGSASLVIAPAAPPVAGAPPKSDPVEQLVASLDAAIGLTGTPR